MTIEDSEQPQDWLLRSVVPWWMTRIVNPNGGYFEALDAPGEAVAGHERTTLAQARLIYVFNHAFVLTGDDSLRKAAAHGYAFLTRHCHDPMTGGWYRAVHDEGRILDAAHDCYDQAFVLLALAWHFRATGDQQCRMLAMGTLDFLSRHMCDPINGGYVEQWGDGPRAPPPYRRQNPHMHLLEAFLAWHAMDGDDRWLANCRAMTTLLQTRFFEPSSGTLIEYFGCDWSPAVGEAGRWREPGHHFEWVWLLHQYGRYDGNRVLETIAERLWQFGTERGIDHDVAPTDLAFDGVDEQGVLLADTKLLWPQTELLKACVARVERFGDDTARSQALRTYAQMRRHYFDDNGVRWANQLMRDGRKLDRRAPARILYHVFVAITEMQKLTGAA